MRVEHGPGPVRRLVLDRPEHRNRLDADSVGELLEAIGEAERDPRVTTLVLAAEGADFCSGLHLENPHDDGWRAHVEQVGLLLSRVRESPLVTVAQVAAAATGGGVGLAAACDLVLAGPDAVFRMTEVLLGLVPALILPLVAARVGARRALALALLARPVEAAEAHLIGLADARCDSVEAELAAVLRRLRSAEPGAVRALKRYASGLAPDGSADPQLPLDVLAERMARPEVRERLSRLALLRPPEAAEAAG